MPTCRSSRICRDSPLPLRASAWPPRQRRSLAAATLRRGPHTSVTETASSRVFSHAPGPDADDADMPPTAVELPGSDAKVPCSLAIKPARVDAAVDPAAPAALDAAGALVGASDDSARCTDGSANGFNPPPSMSSIGTTLYDMVAAAAEDARPQWKRE